MDWPGGKMRNIFQALASRGGVYKAEGKKNVTEKRG